MFSSKFLSKGIPTRNCARCQVECDPGECPSNNLNWPANTLWSSQCHSCRGDMLAWCESSRDQSRDHSDLHPILIQVNSDENSHLSFIAISFKCPLLEVLLELLSHSSTRREFISVSEKLLLRALMYLQKKMKMGCTLYGSNKKWMKSSSRVFRRVSGEQQCAEALRRKLLFVFLLVLSARRYSVKIVPFSKHLASFVRLCFTISSSSRPFFTVMWTMMVLSYQNSLA